MIMKSAPWPAFTEEETAAVRNVLLSNKVNYWTGEEGRTFEREFAAWCGTRCAVAVANGTLALDLCWKALGIGEGDEVIVTPRTFIASASSIANTGATPVFADVDTDSQNITAESVEPLLTERTKAICLVHLAGWPCEMDDFKSLVSGRNIALVEDCAQAHGAKYKGLPVGGLGDLAAWSFCQDKIMTTGGEGGMVTTNSEEYWRKIWSYKDHGKSFEAVYERDHPPGFRWLHESLGTNWRLTEMQSAIGRIQLQRMGGWHSERAANGARLMATLSSVPGLRVPDIPAHIEHAMYKAYVFVRPEMLKQDWSRDRIMAAVVERGFQCFSGSCSEVYLEKAFDYLEQDVTHLVNASMLGQTSLMFLVHPGVGSDYIDALCESLSEIMSGAIR